MRKLLLFAAALYFVGAVHAQNSDVRKPEPQKVGPSSWYVEGASALGSPANRNFISNAGFVVTPKGVVIIDALGSPELAQELIGYIKQITSGKPISHVIVTHYHADHIYGLQAFKAAGAKIIAHQSAREYLNSPTAAQRLEVSRTDLAPFIDANTRLVLADEWINGSRELTIDGLKFVVQAVGPAHTPEDLVVYVPSEKVLFAGDLVFRGRIPFVGQANSKQWIASLDTLLAFNASAIVPGHGPASNTAQADLQLTRDYLQYLRDTMGKAAKNLDSFDEAYAAVDWRKYEQLPLFKAANRMNAYNTFLLMEREQLAQ